MRTISKQQQSAKQERSTFICKEIDPDYLGREIYADNIKTPYSFYLVRRLTLAKDYQNLAEGEAFFDAICDSWDATDDFEELVVKKIYMYVETEVMYYTLLMGSFEPTKRVLRTDLKHWLEDISLEKEERSLIYKGEPEINTGEMQSMMKQMIETSNEIFRLRKMIDDLSETINQGKIEVLHQPKIQPVISRSIKTIHLKRAQPLLLEDDHLDSSNATEESIEKNDLNVLSDSVEKAAGNETEKKPQIKLNEKPTLENSPIADERFTSLKPKVKDDADAKEKITENNVTKPELKALTLVRGKALQLQPENWLDFSLQLEDSQMVDSSTERSNVEPDDLENLENEIYQCFVNKRKRLGDKKKHTKKKRVLRSDLLAQIEQAEYLNYSWGQVLRKRQEDVLICGRLSSSSLVSSLDEFLDEVRGIAYSRSLFGKKVRCSIELLRRLEGYVLMDQFMQKLIILSDEPTQN
ncbi:hypothetical protein [Enterococcus sp. 5H]|uniref:hypothetical protein n=1 Tax=Enterococcus sp. 5H TaxID=1229490 RepID=UPI002302ED31|nr:hypothetical protein [Enterococcus sp. 5H]MDA9469967.1 hypothetical protein [Enterococcus sp. 5H]